MPRSSSEMGRGSARPGAGIRSVGFFLGRGGFGGAFLFYLCLGRFWVYFTNQWCFFFPPQSHDIGILQAGGQAPLPKNNYYFCARLRLILSKVRSRQLSLCPFFFVIACSSVFLSHHALSDAVWIGGTVTYSCDVV
jgi:hypothetical protein